MKALALALALAAWASLLTFMLAGCARGPRADIAPPLPQIVTVDRVVTETCLAPGEVPALPAHVGALLNGNAAHDAEMLAATVLADQAWQGRAEALLMACAATSAH